MKIRGRVRISLSLNVYDLDTSAAYVDSYGGVRISDDDQFFIDWASAWEQGTGELMGASVESCDLENDDDGEDGDDYEESERPRG